MWRHVFKVLIEKFWRVARILFILLVIFLLFLLGFMKFLFRLGFYMIYRYPFDLYIDVINDKIDDFYFKDIVYYFIMHEVHFFEKDPLFWKLWRNSKFFRILYILIVYMGNYIINFRCFLKKWMFRIYNVILFIISYIISFKNILLKRFFLFDSKLDKGFDWMEVKVCTLFGSYFFYPQVAAYLIGFIQRLKEQKYYLVFLVLFALLLISFYLFRKLFF